MSETRDAIIDAQNTPRGSYRILKTLSDRMGKEAKKDLQKRLCDALTDFPELNGETVTVGRLKPSKEYLRGDPAAVADPYNRMIYVPTDDYTDTITLYHELAHLAIRVQCENGNDLPATSEPFCSIFAVARMPPQKVDRQRIAYLGKSPKDTMKFPEICDRALEYRENHRNYIQKCKHWLEV